MAKKKRNKIGFKATLFLTFGLLLAVVFAPTSLILVVGMIPTFVAYIVDRNPAKIKSLTVGAMNLAGCVPIIIELWMTQHTVHSALNFLSQPRTIVVIYMAAAIGYMVEVSVTGIVSSLMKQKGHGRIKEIDKQQKNMVKRWGIEVTGGLVLDEYGFPIDPDSAEELKKKYNNQQSAEEPKD